MFHSQIINHILLISNTNKDEYLISVSEDGKMNIVYLDKLRK